MYLHRPTSPPAGWPRSATLAEIPGGIAGTRATLRTMADLIRRARLDIAVRSLAVMIVAGLPHKAYAEQAGAICRWVQQNIQFVRDIRGVETLTPPAYLIEVRAGDCDDQAMLVAALAESIGLPSRLVAGGPRNNYAVHVWAEIYAGGRWIACETTEPWRPGVRPPFPYTLVQAI